MTDREKVIKGLECLANDSSGCSTDCPYYVSLISANCFRTMAADALAMLREQEPVTMKPYYFNYVCSECGSEIDGEFIDYTGGKIKYCPECGRKVKWDEAD